MADEQSPAQPDIAKSEPERPEAGANEDMDLEPAANADEINGKREREGGEEESEGVPKKQKTEEVAEKSVEEERLEKKEIGLERVKLGPREFTSAVEMFDYFYKLMHFWPTGLDFNKYEQMVLLDLIKKGHPEPERKIGGGIKSFRIQNHPVWQNRCFFLIREDESVDDFSFRKCVDHILPLPENMKANPGGHKSGFKGHGGGKGGGRGRGRGGKSRN